jgi:hypothetical protein
MTLNTIWGKVWEWVETVEWTWDIWQSKDETAKEVISLLSKNVTNFGFFTLTDLTEVWEPHKNLLNKSLWSYNWVDISFQGTKLSEWGVIKEYSYNRKKWCNRWIDNYDEWVMSLLRYRNFYNWRMNYENSCRRWALMKIKLKLD